MFIYLQEKPEYYAIGETYLKLDFEFSESNKILLKEIYSKKLKGISKEFFKSSEIKVSIEFDKGSLKTKIRVWGLVATIYIGIGQYGSFRQGVREIIQDIHGLSEYVIQAIENEQPIGPEHIIRIEKRTGLSGRINNIYNRIDRLERKLNDLSQNEIRDELNSIKQEISNITSILPDDIQQQLLDELPDNYRNNLPAPNNRRVNYLISRYALKPNEEVEFIEE